MLDWKVRESIGNVARPLCASHMVGGLSFCLSNIRSPLYHPSSYLIIIGVCKTHPPQADTDISLKPMQAAPSNGGCTCVGFFHFRDFLHFDTQWPTLVLIRNATEQRTTRIRLNIHLWPTWSPSSLLKFLAAGKGDPVGFFLYPARSQKKLAVCLNSTLISDIELFFYP